MTAILEQLLGWNWDTVLLEYTLLALDIIGVMIIPIRPIIKAAFFWLCAGTIAAGFLASAGILAEVAELIAVIAGSIAVIWITIKLSLYAARKSLERCRHGQ